MDGFKNLTAYHAGDGVWAELDILLDENTPLARSHDVAETIQYCCEALTEVDRAFVTTDCKSWKSVAFMDPLADIFTRYFTRSGGTLVAVIHNVECRNLVWVDHRLLLMFVGKEIGTHVSGVQ